MNNQKRENLLDPALDATEEEWSRSVNPNMGYDPGEKTWELIVRYNGSLESLRDGGIRVDELAAGYTVLAVPESRIEQVSAMEQVVHTEKPRGLFFANNTIRAASCLGMIQTSSGAGTGGAGTGGAGAGIISSLESGLTGKGMLVTVVDSGINYFHPDFRNPDGTTRIGLLADQDGDRIYIREGTSAALKTEGRTSVLALVSSTDPSGYGAAVAVIAAGNGRKGNGVYRGITYESELMVVRLGTSLTDSFPRTAQLMKAPDLVVQRAQGMNRSLAVNINLGDTYDSYGGTSLLETLISDILGIGRNVIVAGTGNEGTGAEHRVGSLVIGQKESTQLSTAPYEIEMGIQLWKSYMDQFSIRLITPSGEVIGPIDNRLDPQTLRYGGMQTLICYDKPSFFSRAQEAYFGSLPVRDYLDNGIWIFRLTSERIVTGQYDMWLPFKGILNPSTRFLRPASEATLITPSTAANVTSAGAYGDSYRAYVDFPGHGSTCQTGQVKPDLVTPGVDIVTARWGGEYETVTGTSFAAPFVTGSVALLMQWRILQGNDPFPYGEKVKVYLTRGARYLPGYDVWPDKRLGYGALCMRDSPPLGDSQNL